VPPQFDRDGTLRQVITALPEFGDRPAILTLRGDRELSLSYRELYAQIERLTGALSAQQDIVAQRVAILAPNRPEWVIACLAVVNAGAVAIPVDAKLDEESLEHVLADCEPSIIFASSDERDRIRRLASHPFRMVDLDGESDDQSGYQAPTAERSAHPPELDPADPAVIFYTSGTTGPPKGVPLSHRNLLFELQSLRSFGLMSPSERLLLPLPLHHVYPFVVGMLAPLVYGVSIVLPQSMTGPHIQQAIKSGRVATVLGVPRLYETLISSIGEGIASSNWVVRLSYRALRRVSLFAGRRLSLRLGQYFFWPLHRRIGPDLRLLASGGAALDQKTAWALESLGWTVATGYGLTETSPLLTIVPPGDKHFETVGKPIAGVEIRIAPLDEQGRDDATSETGAGSGGSRNAGSKADCIGEIQAKGPNVFEGYLNLPDRSAEAFTEDGWFRTEDRGWIDGEGYLRVVGRASTFVVTSAGKNISLEDLERTYENHSLIKEIGIFMREQALSAVVVPDPSGLRKADVTSADQVLRDAIRECSHWLPRYKQVENLVVSQDALARTRLGKIRRNKLRERFENLWSGKIKPGEKAGAMAVEDMSGEDQGLLEHASTREVWVQLAENYPGVRLSPDSDLTLDLGIDSLEWINITLAIRERTGIELSEAATERIRTVRDLLKEVLGSADQAEKGAADLEEEPERFLTPNQRRWLKPLGPIESVFARILYSVNRILVRTIFRLRVSGLENLRSADQIILTPNHASVLDPFIVAAAVPYDLMRRSAFAGWTGMAFANPLYRAVARLGRTFPIEQDRAAFSSLALALVTLGRGENLIWFPEGRRSRDGDLQPLQPGIGVLLKMQPVPIIPAIIDGTFDAMPPGRRIPRPREIRIRFGHICHPQWLDDKGRGERPEHRMVDGLRREMARLQDQNRA